MRLSNKIIQKVLAKAGLYDGKIDGKIGRKTRAAMAAVADPAGRGRYEIRVVQTILSKAHTLVGQIDGLYGPKTQAAIEEYLAIGTKDEWTRSDASTNEPVVLKNNESSHSYIPNYSELTSFYGQRGSNLIKVKAPYQMRLAWNTSKRVTSLTVNKKAATDLVKVLNQTKDHYGMEKIRDLGLDLYGGIFNNRKMRGGSHWSVHSWGVAMDIDPARNALRTKSPKARLSKKDAERWFEFWEDLGWVSLGRSKNYDWMHVQRVRL